MTDVARYLNSSIDQMIRKIFFFSFMNIKERHFLIHAVLALRKAARRRLRFRRQGEMIPPFLIASISTQCNLHCAGCYARANHACTDNASSRELSAPRWGELFAEAEELGISFILLAGGEPLERLDILTQAAQLRSLIFPVFTNGTLFTEKVLELFDANRQLVPILSLEGGQLETDARRGSGAYRLVTQAMTSIRRRGMFYGVSVTVTRENLHAVSDAEFVQGLRENGCRLMLFVEYVPADGRGDLAPGETERRRLAARINALRSRFAGIVFISFPGDENQLGGCLAAGRGFFHINAFGGAEPCPFSPYSDVDLRAGKLRQALRSPLFQKIRESGAGAMPHAGGCALFEARDEVEALLHAPSGAAGE